MDIDKGMKAVIKGIFHGVIIKNFKGKTFEEKFLNFLYYDGITHCRWINKTDYDNYYNTLFTLVKTINSDLEKLKLIHNLLEIKRNSTSQGITKIFLKKDFFKEYSNHNELTIDLYIEIFKELAGIIESYIKLIYGIKANYTTNDIIRLNKKKFYYFWKDLKNDQNLRIFTKPFPNTLQWNAGKHNGITKKIKTKEIEFNSNEGIDIISCENFVLIVRELYACTIVLTKIKLMIIFQNKTFL